MLLGNIYTYVLMHTHYCTKELNMHLNLLIIVLPVLLLNRHANEYTHIHRLWLSYAIGLELLLHRGDNLSTKVFL